MMRWFGLAIALLTQLGCASLQEEVFIADDPVIEAPVIVEESPLPQSDSLKRSQEVCPESGDGIGGTGCPDRGL